jgi:spore coat protein U-like protein
MRAGPLASGMALMVLALLASPDAAAAADCSIATTGVAFGNYDASVAAATDSAAELTVRCIHLSGSAARLNYTVALSAGNSGMFAARQLRAGSSMLGYNLFMDVARSQIWGDGSSGTFVASGALTVGPGVGNGIREFLHTLYGRIPALQAADAGIYTDTIVVTLSF